MPPRLPQPYLLLLLTCLVLSGSPTMIAEPPTHIDYLSADLLPAIANPEAALFVGRISQLRSQATQANTLTYNVGTLTLDVQEAISPRGPRPGATVEVPFHQIADPIIRAKNGRDQWNMLLLQQGSLILFAATPTTGATFHATAALYISSPDDPQLKAVRLAYATQHASAQSKPSLLAQDLQSPDITVLSHALDALGERNALGPGVGLRLMTEALNNPTTPANNRREIASTLTSRFDAATNPQAQATTIAALAYAMVHESAREIQANFASSLRACILGDLAENPTHRDTILRSIHTPTPDQVIKTLTDLAHDSHAEPDVHERESFTKLAHIWEHASKL